MKIRQIIILALAVLSIFPAYGQGLTIASGSNLVVSGNAAIVVNDGSFINNGAFNSGGGSLYMKGAAPTADSKIQASNFSTFNHVVIDKTANGVQLENSINVNGNMDMQSGTLDLNGKILSFYFDGTILNETEANRILGDSGTIFKAGFLNNPVNENLANMGLEITASQNLNVVYVRRHHGAQMINGAASATRRYEVEYFVPNLTMDYTMNYFDAELNGVSENGLQSWEYESSWQQRTATSIDTTLNQVQVNGRSETDTLWAFANGLLLVTPKVFLEGNYAGGGLMSDHLRSGDLLPLTEPYTALGFTQVGGGGETIDPSVLAVTGNNAITDWLFLELRDKADSTNVLQTTSALLQKDGDIVDLDGVSAVRIANLPPDDYFLTIRHRNHFGVMSATTVAVSTTATSLDFTDPAMSTYSNGADAQNNISGVMAMFSGDSNNDGEVNAIDNNNGWLPQNGQTFIYLTSTADFNLDGTVNAVDKNNVLLINNSKVEQLPGN